MLDVLSNFSVLLAMIVMGYLLKVKGILGPQYRKLFLWLILNVTMPCAIIAGFDMSLNIASLLPIFLIGLATCFAMDLASIYLFRRREPKTRAQALLLSNGYLVAPFAMPFVLANMGAAALMALAVFDIANGLFNMGVNYSLASSLASDDGQGIRFSPLKVLKTMLSSTALVVYLVLLILSALRLSIPPIVLSFSSKVGSANLFLAMTFIGMVLDFNLDAAVIRDLIRMMSLRYAGALAASLLCFFVLPVDPLVAKVVTLALFTPVSNAAMAYSESFGCDPRLYGAASSVSFLVAVSVYAVLFVAWA